MISEIVSAIIGACVGGVVGYILGSRRPPFAPLPGEQPQDKAIRTGRMFK